MNLPKGFEEMSLVQQALTVARHELVKLQGLIATNEAVAEAVALIDKALVQMGNRTEREVLKDCLMDFVKRVSQPGRDLKTPEEVQILPEIASLLTTIFHL